jgi:hypothetical protein
MLVSKTNVLSKKKLQELPEEIVVEVLKHLPSPVDAISLAKTKKLFHNLIVNETSYWSLHGATKIPSTLPSLASTWASRAKSLPPVLRNVLPRLREPLDISSQISIDALSKSMGEIDKIMPDMISASNIILLHKPWKKVLGYAGQAGIEPPLFPSKALNLFNDTVSGSVKDIQLALKEDFETAYHHFVMVIEVAQFAGVQIPWSDETKLLYRTTGQYFTDLAQRQAIKGQVQRMKINLRTAADCAKALNINSTSLSMKGASQKTQSAYETFVRTLGDDVRPLPLQVEAVPSEEV